MKSRARANTLLLVDGHNILWRANAASFEARSSNGTPLHVTSTFLSLLKRVTKLLDDAALTHMAVVFDPKGATSNHALLKEYKANRIYDFENEEDSPFFHLPFIKKALRYMKVKFLERKRTEADDVIGTLACCFRDAHPANKVFIASTDSDFYQLLCPQIQQIVLGRHGSHRVVSEALLYETLGIKPHEYVYFKSLVGDPADNITGVPGIGKVKARQIIRNELPFDPAPHASVLDLNKKLITLTSTLAMRHNWDALRLPARFHSLRANDVFERIGL